MTMDSNIVEFTIKRRRQAPVQCARSPAPTQRIPLPGEDQIFAAIEHHRILSDRLDVALNVSGKMHADEPGYEAAEEITGDAADDLLRQAELLVSAEPTTLTGIVCLLQYLRTLDDWQLPAGEPIAFDCGKQSGWFHDLCEALENAIERISVKG